MLEDMMWIAFVLSYLLVICFLGTVLYITTDD